MIQFWKNYLENNLFFWIFSIIGVLLMICAFILPPIGIIDNSVLIAVGELNGFIALGAVCKAIDKGRSTTFTHKDTSITVGEKTDS